MVLKLEFTPQFEERIKEQAMRKYGFSRGSIKKASEEAFKRWLKEQEQIDVPMKRDPFKTLRGSMSHLKGKYTSVQLQHESVKLWAAKQK